MFKKPISKFLNVDHNYKKKIHTTNINVLSFFYFNVHYIKPLSRFKWQRWKSNISEKLWPVHTTRPKPSQGNATWNMFHDQINVLVDDPNWFIIMNNSSKWKTTHRECLRTNRHKKQYIQSRAQESLIDASAWGLHHRLHSLASGWTRDMFSFPLIGNLLMQ